MGGQWKYLHWAVDRLGQTVEFLLTADRDVATARRFFERAIDRHDVPEKIAIGKSVANTAASHGLVANSGVAIEFRMSKNLNDRVQQDHREIKRIVRPMPGFNNFDCARRLISGIETTHMVKKEELVASKAEPCPLLTSSARSPSDRQMRCRAPLAPTSLLRQRPDFALWRSTKPIAVTFAFCVEVRRRYKHCPPNTPSGGAVRSPGSARALRSIALP